jgi:lipopolysaccharide/colanic/teichoic acid biosynthesis glycosyltransferase/O-antigen/teichoic acid export membrane protein
MAIGTRVSGPHGAHRAEGLVSRALSNLGAQGAALVAVSVASLMVARSGGAAVVGEYALLRVLPWLFAVIFSAGLPTACAYFLAGPRAQDRSLRPTLTWMALGGAVVGCTAWLVAAVPFRALFFKQVPTSLITTAAVLVVTQLLTISAKACCQGSGDIAGANLVIVAEEAYFILCYPVVVAVHGQHGIGPVLAAMIASGVMATLTGAWRLARRGFFSGWGGPAVATAREVAAFGARGQLGNMLWLMNLRFDFVLIGALAGPAALGIYAVASKFAELMRLVPTAMNYVLYPRFAAMGMDRAVRDARRLLPRATGLTLVMAPFMAGLTYVVLPLLYGAQFQAAVAPAEVIIIGLSVEGAAAVSSAFLLGVGRPGLNSLGMGVGTVITVALDLALIPRYGAMGGAVTSAIAYLVTTGTLTLLARRVARSAQMSSPVALAPTRADPWSPAQHAGCPIRVDSAQRRAVDIVVAAVLLVLASPVIIAAALVVRVTSRGPALYRQVRVGKDGQPFTILKIRSMISGAEGAGPQVTYQGDPRVTKIGALLRVLKVDELPQLVNVLRGDMTLIGPRPEVPRFLPWYREDERELFRVRPGLTGPAQIVYTDPAAPTGETSDPESFYVQVELHPKLALDLDYLRRRTVRADVTTVVRTLALVCHLSRGRWSPQTEPDLR